MGNERGMIDLCGGIVEFATDGEGKCWLNVDGRCVVRVYNADEVTIEWETQKQVVFKAND